MNVRSLACGLSLVVAGACHAPSKSAPSDTIAPNAPAQGYVSLDNGPVLAAAIRQELGRGEARGAYEHLDEFMKENVSMGRATHAHLTFEEARPVFLFQHYNGQKYISAVTECGRLLEGEAQKELHGVHAAYSAGDMEAVKRALHGDHSVLCEQNVARDSALLPHAQFFEGALAYDDAHRAGTLDSATAQRIVALMDRSGDAFRRAGAHEPHFSTLIVSAQALEDSGAHDLATERWLLASESAYWPNADVDVRKAIAGRIASYRSRVEEGIKSDYERKLASATKQLQSDFDAKIARAVATADERGKIALEDQRAEFERQKLELRTRMEAEGLQELRRADEDWRAQNREVTARVLEIGQNLARAAANDSAKTSTATTVTTVTTSGAPNAVMQPAVTTDPNFTLGELVRVIDGGTNFLANVVAIMQSHDRPH